MTDYATAPLFQLIQIGGQHHRTWIGENAQLEGKLPNGKDAHSLVIACRDAKEGSAILRRLADPHIGEYRQSLVRAVLTLRFLTSGYYETACVISPDGPKQEIRADWSDPAANTAGLLTTLVGQIRCGERLVGRLKDESPAWLIAS